MHIRTFELADHDAAMRLWESAEHVDTVPLDEVEEKLKRDPELFLVAEDGSGIVGVVMGAYDGRRGWIFRLAVASDRRGAGIGRRLIDELERRFLAMGVTKVNLLVHGPNESGRAFWTAIGYEEFGDVVLCSKRLDGAGNGQPGC